MLWYYETTAFLFKIILPREPQSNQFPDIEAFAVASIIPTLLYTFMTTVFTSWHYDVNIPSYFPSF